MIHDGRRRTTKKKALFYQGLLDFPEPLWSLIWWRWRPRNFVCNQL